MITKGTPLAIIAATLICASASAMADSNEIAIIVKNPYSTFWNNVQLGASDTMQGLVRYTASFQGPNSESDIAQQVRMFEAAIDRKVAGIVLAPSDKKAFAEVIKKAFLAHIPVVLVESDDSIFAKPYYQSMLSSDNAKGGEMAAKAIIEKIGRNGKIAVISNSANSSTGSESIRGFTEYVRNNSSLKIVGPFYSQSKIAGALGQASDALVANPDIRGMFCTDEPTCIGMGRAVANSGRSRGVVAIGSGGNLHLQNFVKNGTLEGVVVQNSYGTGYSAVRTIIAIIENQRVPPIIDTGSVYVTNDNISKPEVINNLF